MNISSDNYKNLDAVLQSAATHADAAKRADLVKLPALILGLGASALAITGILGILNVTLPAALAFLLAPLSLGILTLPAFALIAGIALIAATVLTVLSIVLKNRHLNIEKAKRTEAFNISNADLFTKIFPGLDAKVLKKNRTDEEMRSLLKKHRNDVEVLSSGFQEIINHPPEDFSDEKRARLNQAIRILEELASEETLI